MSKVALNVVINYKPESKNEIISALLSHRARCLKEEPGTLQFEIMIPFDSQSKIYLYELYTNDAALLAHSNGASLARYREEVKNKIQNDEVHKCSLANESTP